MPELPEVETVRAGLTPRVVGRRILGVDVLHLRATRRQAEGFDFADALIGQTITGVSRRGKYMWLPLSSGDALLTHLGMSGQFRFPEPPGPGDPEPTHSHLRVRLRLLDPATGQLSTCWFLDQRTFGGMSISVDGAELPHELAHIGRDPLDPLFDLGAAVAKIRSRHVGIKRVLLDQTVVSGIGNIYADEALWRTRLHFARDASLLRRGQVVELVAAVSSVFDEALLAGGTSFDSLYVNVNGESGYFDRTLAAYGQQGRPCPRCGTPIRRAAFMNRSSHYCPHCQRTPRAPRW